MIPPPLISTLFPYTTLFRSINTMDLFSSLTLRNLTLKNRIALSPMQQYSATNGIPGRSEEHTSELQSRFDLVCRLLLEKKKWQIENNGHYKQHLRIGWMERA